MRVAFSFNDFIVLSIQQNCFFVQCSSGSTSVRTLPFVWSTAQQQLTYVILPGYKPYQYTKKSITTAAICICQY